MREKKSEVRFFTIADWEKEEEYLRKRHKIGRASCRERV